jgi:hypothetical protein
MFRIDLMRLIQVCGTLYLYYMTHANEKKGESHESETVLLFKASISVLHRHAGTAAGYFVWHVPARRVIAAMGSR